jgi:hypothetical protein
VEIDENLTAIMRGVWDANRKLDRIVWLLEGEDEEEEETDPDA